MTRYISTSHEMLEKQLRNEMLPIYANDQLNILAPQHFVTVVRGEAYVRNTGLQRECRLGCYSNMPIQGTEKRVAMFGCRGAGWWRASEVVYFRTGVRGLIWKRINNQAEIFIDGIKVGRIELGWWLNHICIGSGMVWLDEKPFCKFVLPVLGPASPQTSDCTGNFIFAKDQHSIKYVINDQDSQYLTATKASAISWGWARLFGRKVPMPERSQFGMQKSKKSIFYPTDADYLARYSDEQRLVLLALAIWPWSLYKGGGI